MPRKLYAFVLSALFIFSTSTFAEVETTSSIRGEVNVSGAEVTVTHVQQGLQKLERLTKMVCSLFLTC